MNRQQKNRKDRRRFARLMSLTLSASMVLGSSVFAYGSPIDPNAAGMIAEQAVEEAVIEQQAGLASKSIVATQKQNANMTIQYGVSVADLANIVKDKINVEGRTNDTTDNTRTLTYDTDYVFEQSGLFKEPTGTDPYIGVGTYDVTVIGKAGTDYAGMKAATPFQIEIVPLEISENALTVEFQYPTGGRENGYTFDGTQKKPTVSSASIIYTNPDSKKVVSWNDKNLVAAPQYGENVNAYTGTLTGDPANAPYVSVSTNGNFKIPAPKKEYFKIQPASISSAQISYTGATLFKYNGQAQGPGKNDFTVKVGETTLTPDVDYDIWYHKGATSTNALPSDTGDYTVEIVGKGNYTNIVAKNAEETEKLAFKIEGGTAFNSQNVEITIKNQTYTGSQVDVLPSIVAIDRITGAKLEAGKDFSTTITYKDAAKENIAAPIQPGYYYAVVNGDGTNYIGTQEIMFRIVQNDISGAIVTFNAAQYDGAEHRPSESIDIKIQGSSVHLNKNIDYTYDIDDMTFVDAGHYNITFHGKNTYEGTEVVGDYYIEPRAIDATGIEREVGNALSKIDNTRSLSVRVRDRGLDKIDDNTIYKLLKEGKDYEVIKNANNTVTIRGIWNYNGSINEEIKSEDKINLADSKITAKLKAGSMPYVGRAIEPKATEFEVVETAGTSSNSYTLEANKDYTVSRWFNNTKVGTATALVQAAGSRYTGETMVEFDITGIDLSANYTINETGLEKEVDYSPLANKDYATDIRNNLTRRIVAKADSTVTQKTLNRWDDATKTGDYKVSFLLNGEKVTEVRDAGEYTVVVTGCGNYSGELTTTFTIKGTDINTVLKASLSQNSFEYAGQAITPEVTVTTNEAMDALVEGTDYEIVYTDNNKVGTAYAIVKGKGRYSGTISLEFKITGDPDITPTPVGPQDQVLSVRYDQTLSRQLGLTLNMNGKAETAVQYKSSNTKVATVSSTGKVTCKAVGTAVITTTAVGTDEYKEATKTLTLTVMPKKVGVKSVKTTNKKGQAVVQSATTTAGNDGYQIQYTNNGVTKRVGVKTSKKSVTKTLTKLTSGKKVRVRIRAYKYVDGKAIFGPYCNWKTTTTRVK